MLKKLLVLTISVIVAAHLLPGVQINSVVAAVVVAVVLILLNAFVKPVLLLLSLPITVVTLGLFLIVINIFVIYLTDQIVDGFSVDNWMWAVLFSLILSLMTAVLEGGDDKNRR